jgi:multidrug efflux pump
MIVLMLLAMMVQLVSFRRLLLVSVLPLGLIGVVGALLLFNQPLGFVAILGILALMGMIAKNALILIVRSRSRNGPAASRCAMPW